jgi:bifunctional non-homologous end joining protein LigD
MDAAPGSLDQLLALAARDEAEGLGDAPWPPHFAKAEGEPKRVQPSKAKKFSDQLDEGFGSKRFRKQAIKKESASEDASPETSDTPDTSAPAKKPRKPRASTQPLIIVAQSTDKSAAEAGLDRWKATHPQAAQHLAVDDILIDRMRGSSSIWYRIRINLRHVPEEIRPTQQTPDPDDDPTRVWRENSK